MSTTTTRRDVVKLATGLVLGAGLAGGVTPVEAAAATPRDMAAILDWEDALAAADKRGAEWMERAELTRMLLEQAALLAGRGQITTLVGPLAELLAEAEAILAERQAAFDAWAAVAWRLDDLAPLPPEPWA